MTVFTTKNPTLLTQLCFSELPNGKTSRSWGRASRDLEILTEGEEPFKIVTCDTFLSLGSFLGYILSAVELRCLLEKERTAVL